MLRFNKHSNFSTLLTASWALVFETWSHPISGQGYVIGSPLSSLMFVWKDFMWKFNWLKLMNAEGHILQTWVLNDHHGNKKYFNMVIQNPLQTYWPAFFSHVDSFHVSLENPFATETFVANRAGEILFLVMLSHMNLELFQVINY